MIVEWMRPGKPGDCIRCDRTLVTINLICMKTNTFVWLTRVPMLCYAKLMSFFVLLAMSCMRLNESPLLCYAMLCFMCLLFSNSKMAAKFYVSFVLQQQNGGQVLCVFCSPTAKWRQSFMCLLFFNSKMAAKFYVSFVLHSKMAAKIYKSLFSTAKWRQCCLFLP